MQWERLPLKFLPPCMRVSWERLQSIERSLKGMELALASTSSPPIKTLTLDHNLKENMTILVEKSSGMLINEHRNDQKTLDKPYDQAFHVITPQNLHDLPSLFFLFCMKLLHGGDQTLASPSPSPPQERKVTPTTTDHPIDAIDADSSCKDRRTEIIKSIWSMSSSLLNEKIVVGLKCSLSLGLAVLFGVLFSKENGYWSGLMVATAFTPHKEATLSSASARAHGTALGSAYGVLGSFISQNLMEVRLLVLVPWVFFSSFLYRSRMYGQPGAIATATTAMIILGRRNYGSPMIFSIQRLTEAYIGLCCFIFVELLFQPTRSSTMARARLAQTLQALSDCIGSTVASPSTTLKEMEKKLSKLVVELKQCIETAELEPNLWFLPFPSACYNKLHNSISKFGDLLVFLSHARECLVKETGEIEESIKVDLVRVQELVGNLVKSLEEVIQLKSVEGLLTNDNFDLEEGKGPQQGPWANWAQLDGLVGSFVENAKGVVERVVDDGADVRRQMVLCLGTIGFCIGELVREAREVEKGVLELVQWENPSCCVNLCEITSKIKYVSN